MREIGFQKSLRSTKMVAYMFFEMKAKVKRKAPCSSSAGDFFLPTRILGPFASLLPPFREFGKLCASLLLTPKQFDMRVVSQGG